MIDNKLGFIGLGNMGYPMAKNLGKIFKVSIFDQNKEKIQTFEKDGNFKICKSLEDFRDTKTVFFMLPNDEIITKICLQDGLFDILPETSTIIDCSTISLKGFKTLNNFGKEKLINYIDCPVSGG